MSEPMTVAQSIERACPNGYDIIPGGGEIFLHAGNVFVKVMQFTHRGQMAVSHSHAYDHLTLLCNGSLLVDVDGEARVYDAMQHPCAINVKAGREHILTCFSDSALALCIHDTRGLDPEDLGTQFVRE